MKFRKLAVLAILAVVVIGGAQLVTTLTSTDLNPAGPGDEPVLVSSALSAPDYPIPMEYGIEVGVDNASWSTVTLGYVFVSPVVIATPSYSSSEPPLVTRIRNASGSSFELRVGRADNSTTAISGIDVHWIVVEAGIYDAATYGITMEASTVSSTVTDNASSWVGQSQSFSNTYTSPVVLGQVMTYADVDFSVFWARGNNRQQAPDSSNLWLGKHVGEDPDTARTDETLGYLVIESGSGTLGSANYEAVVGAQLVRGWDDTPPYTYTHSISAATTVILSSAGMDTTDGAWPILHEPSPVSSTDFDTVVQEDQENDAELSHGTEQVAYLVLD